MKTGNRTIASTFLFGVAVALAVPPLVFLGSGLIGGMGLGDVLSALMEQYASDRQNLAMVGGLGVVPFALLAAALALSKRFAGAAAVAPMAWGGTLMITGVLVWTNLEYWPSYLPDRQFLGWPHGIEFLIGPVFFAPVAMLVGMVLGWAVHRAGAE